MFLFYVLSLFKKGDTIQEGTLFKGGHYLRKYGKPIFRALSRFLNLDSNIFSPFFLSPPNSRWATALLLFNEFFKKQLKFEINCIFKMPTWSYFNLFTLKNWVIFSHVEKNCQNQKKNLNRSSTFLNSNTNSIYTQYNAPLFSSSFFGHKSCVIGPIFFSSQSQPQAQRGWLRWGGGPKNEDEKRGALYCV